MPDRISMKITLVADSSANIHSSKDMSVNYVPLRIVTDEKEYIDNSDLNVQLMLNDMKAYKGRSSTACPGVNDWIDAFDDADMVLGATLTSNLSGCYNSARLAAEEYMEMKPDAKVFIMDSLSTGPELQLLLEKMNSYVKRGISFEKIKVAMKKYSKHTHLIFSLESVDNFVKNGRINPILGKAVGALGIRIVGKASDEGTLEPLHKVRGENKSVAQLMKSLEEMGYKGGKIRISHSYNSNMAFTLSKLIREKWPNCDISVSFNRGLCCYYAEEGSILIGFEDI